MLFLCVRVLLFIQENVFKTLLEQAVERISHHSSKHTAPNRAYTKPRAVRHKTTTQREAKAGFATADKKCDVKPPLAILRTTMPTTEELLHSTRKELHLARAGGAMANFEPASRQ